MRVSIIVAIVWFIVAYLVIRVIKGRWPELNLPATATFGVLAVAVAFWFAWNTFRDVTVNEAIVVGVATMAVGLALVVRIHEEYGTVEEDEIHEQDSEI